MNSSILSKIRWPRPLAGLRGITLADVPREVSAGVTLAALMIPLNIGYAQVAGLPPVAGLYAAIIPLVVRSYSNKYGYKADGDQMLFAYGAANLAAAFTGSIVTGNSPSRSAAMVTRFIQATGPCFEQIAITAVPVMSNKQKGKS